MGFIYLEITRREIATQNERQEQEWRQDRKYWVINVCIYPTPPSQARYDTRAIFK